MSKALPINVPFSSAMSLCGRCLFIRPRLVILKENCLEKMFLGCSVVWLEESRSDFTILLADIEIDVDTQTLKYDNFVYTNKRQLMYFPVKFVRFVEGWVEPSFKMHKEVEVLKPNE